ncbi:MAG TPA: hypothetical protein DCP31_37850 [Cyanobacteria bacterium UBA8543]|nr:hypothetical protein [Cyanobacteria bacterium UBA8543]
MSNPSNEQKAIAGVNIGGNAEINVNQSINQLPYLTQEDLTERDSRKKLLNNVRNNWLHLLQQPFCEATIKLELKTRFDLVKNPFSDQQDKIDRPDKNTNIEDIFNQWQPEQRLLILGVSGAGKTITLLQLAQKFLSAITDENVLEKPIPVVFHLSSWKNGQSIEEWLIQELSDRYGFPKLSEQVENWVRSRKLFLFLDGFDQVEVQYQQNCAEEINKFGLSDVVVCSRSEQYEALPKDVRLHIGHAVCIEPLTNIQINEYLETLNKPNLKQILDKDKELGELAKIPFWFKIITDVGECFPGECSSEDRKNKLFDEYIKTRFIKIKRDERDEKLKYDEKKTIEWLAWLASQSKSVFLIEEMQSSWLTKGHKKFYLGAILFIGLLLGLLSGIPYGIIIHFYISYSLGLSQVSLKDGIVLGILAGVILGTAVQYSLKLHKLPIKTHKEVILSWQEAQNTARNLLRTSIRETIGIGGLVFLFCFFILYSFYPINIRLWMGLICGVFFGSVTLIPRLLSDSLVERKEVKTLKPNQGILESLKTACLVAKIASVIVAIINTLWILIVHHNHLDKLPVTLILGLGSAVVTGGVVASIHDSGRACQQHLALRIVLYITGNIPWNYEDFLNYVSEPNKLKFLNRIGGGYQFFHGLFKQHLASLKRNRNR